MSEEQRKLADKIGVYAQTVNIEHFYSGSSAPSGDPKGLHNLPPGIPNAENFFGRRSELDQLVQLLREPRQVLIAAVEGMGGIGKTELAIQYARQYQQDYGAVLWIRAAEALEMVVNSTLEVFPELSSRLQRLTQLEDQVQVCWRQWQRIEGRVLVIFDDVGEVGEVLKAVPPVQDPFRVIFTSRQDFIDPRRFVKLRLGVLEEAAALDLLRSIAGEVIDQDLEQARILCERLGYLPLALELVGAFLVQEPDQRKVLADLQRYGLSAEALTEANWAITAERGVKAAFELSWDRLSSEDQRLAVILGLMALAPIPWDLLVAVDQRVFETSRRLQRQEGELPEGLDGLEGWDPKPLERAKRHLKGLNLIEDLGDQVYQLHPLIREFFQEHQRSWEPQAEVEGIKSAYAGLMVQEAKRIGQNITIDEVERIRPSIPHLSLVAEDIEEWKPYVPDENLIGLLTGLGRILERIGSYDRAESFFKDCLRVTKDRFGAAHLDVATSYNNLAELYRAQGRYKEAESLYHKDLAISLKLLGEEHEDIATSYNNLALLYQLQGRYDEAEPLYQRALALRQKLLGEEHQDVAQSFNNLAEIYRCQGRYDEAEPLYQKSLELKQALLGLEHPSVAISYNNLALLYRLKGKYEESEELHQKALALRQKRLGEKHPSVATSYNNLAFLYQSQGRYGEAEELYQQALTLRQEFWGDNHPDVATSYNSLATLYRDQGRYQEAESRFQQALTLRQRLLGDNHPSVANSLNNLGILHLNQQQYDQAEGYLEQALEIYQLKLGSDHPYTQETAQALQQARAMQVFEGQQSQLETILD